MILLQEIPNAGRLGRGIKRLKQILKTQAMKSSGTPIHKHKEALELDTELMLVSQDPVTHGDRLVRPDQARTTTDNLLNT